MTTDPQPKTALILVDHGSRLAEANAMLHGVAALVAREADGRYVAVEPAHMELAEPTIEQAMDKCVAAGAERVVVTLFFLSPGRHSTDDIPRLAREAAAKHPQIQVAVSKPLGVSENIAGVILERAEQAEGWGENR